MAVCGPVRCASAQPLAPCLLAGDLAHAAVDGGGWRCVAFPVLPRHLAPSLALPGRHFDESVPYYRLFPYRTAPLPLPPLFLAPGAAVADPLPPQGAAPSGVSQVDPVEPVEVAVDSRPAGGAEPGGAEPEGLEPGGVEPGGVEPGGVEPGGVELEGAKLGGVEPRGAELRSPESGGSESGGTRPRSPAPGGALSSEQLRAWYLEYCSLRRGTARAGRTTGTGASASSPVRELPSRERIREWYERRRTLRSGVPRVTDPAAVGAAAGAEDSDVGAAAGAEDPGVGAAAGAEDLSVGAAAGAEDPGVGAAAGAEDPGVGAAAGAADPGVGDATGAEDPGVGAAAGAEDPGVGAGAGAEDPGVGATAGAADPGVGAATGAEDPGVGAAAGAEDPGVGAAAGAEDPGVGAAASAVDPGVGSATGAQDPGVGAATGAEDVGAGAAVCASDPGAGVPAGSGVAARSPPYFVTLLQQVLGQLPPPFPPPSLACPPPVQLQSALPSASSLPGPAPYTGPTGGLTEWREPASRPASPESRPESPVRTALSSSRVQRQRLPAVPGTHQMALRPSTGPQRVPLPSPPASSLPALADPGSDSLRATSPTVTRLPATVVTDPSFESAAAYALVAELVEFAACCRLDYAASLVAESESVCPPSVGGECALGTDVLEDRQEEFECFAAALPHLVSMFVAPEGDPDAPDIPTPRSYAEAMAGPYSSQWVKRPSGSPPVFKARYVARGFSQREGVDFFQTFSPTPKMTTLRVLLHVAAQRDYELHSLDFSTAFLQGSLHEEIWLRRPPGFTGSFPPGTQWSL
ncbi:unnamed protein product [Closterium sp. NIES-65]|nr:unnamed protein product [Closterium sp. NIES-65]